MLAQRAAIVATMPWMAKARLTPYLPKMRWLRMAHVIGSVMKGTPVSNPICEESAHEALLMVGRV
jgi:hypothetical protein